MTAAAAGLRVTAAGEIRETVVISRGEKTGAADSRRLAAVLAKRGVSRVAVTERLS